MLLPFKVLPDLLDQLAKRLVFEGDLVPVAQVPDPFVAYCFGVVGVQDKQKVFTQERVLVPFGSWCHLYADDVELLVFHGGDDVVEFNYLVKLFIQVVLVVDYDAVLVLFVLEVCNRDVFKMVLVRKMFSSSSSPCSFLNILEVMFISISLACLTSAWTASF